MSMPHAHYPFPSWETTITGYYDSLNDVIDTTNPLVVHAALRQELEKSILLVKPHTVLCDGLRHYATTQPEVKQAIEWALVDNYDKGYYPLWEICFKGISPRFEQLTQLPLARSGGIHYCIVNDYRQTPDYATRHRYLFYILRMHLLEALSHPEIRDLFGGLPPSVQQLYLDYRWYHARYQKESKATRLSCLLWYHYYDILPPTTIQECVEGWNTSGTYDGLYMIVYHLFKNTFPEFDPQWFQSLEWVLEHVFEVIPLAELYRLDPYQHPIHAVMLPYASFVMLTSLNRDMLILFQRGILRWLSVVDELWARKAVLTTTELSRLHDWIAYVLTQALSTDVGKKIRHLGVYYDLYNEDLYHMPVDIEIRKWHEETRLPMSDCIDIVYNPSDCDTIEEIKVWI